MNDSSSRDDVNDSNSSDDDRSGKSCTDTNINLSGLNRSPLYAGTDVTIAFAMCLIMQFALLNNLTNEAISKFLRLLDLLLPSPNHLPKSFYKFKKFFNHFSVPYTHSEVCTACSNCKEDCQCDSTAQGTGHLVDISLIKPLSAILTNY